MNLQTSELEEECRQLQQTIGELEARQQADALATVNGGGDSSIAYAHVTQCTVMDDLS